MLNGIFEDKLTGDYFWIDNLDEYEYEEAKYFTYENECVDYHKCIKSALYNDMTGYVDEVQNEEYYLCSSELYVVLYNEFEESSGGLFSKVDFGITKQEIIENVKNQKYVEGATYFTIGHMLFATRMIMERKYNYEEEVVK